MFGKNCVKIPENVLCSGYYGSGGYVDAQRMSTFIDQHVSVISSVSSSRSVSAYSEVHDPLNILDDTSRKTARPFYTELASMGAHTSGQEDIKHLNE